MSDAAGDIEIEETTFPVSKEELSILRADLACEFPDDHTTLSDDYILSVASKPYSKDPTVRRPIEYSGTKLKELLEWRQSNAVHLQELLDIAKEGDSSPAASESPEKYAKAKALATSLNYGSMYWRGVDKEGRPVLWIRTNRMPWFPDVEAQVNALILLADAGIRTMPAGVTDFVVLSDSNSPPPPNPQFLMNLLSALIKGYPDRLHLLVSCPVGTIIQTVMKLLLPLMPTRLSSKIVLISEGDAKEKLGNILLNGEEEIPTFLGGKCNHDEQFPTEGSFPNKLLKFDFDGMIERLQGDIDKFEKSKEKN
jgi:CRAL/TRIO domain.